MPSLVFWVPFNRQEQYIGQCPSQLCVSYLFVKLTLVIGVIGADMSNVIANMFATSNVSKEFQSIAVAIVVTMLGVSATIGQSITSALITGPDSTLHPQY
jgi:uncharacterized membrane protein YeaQ/YmgE (transglycosylase-associated protein family)